MTRTAAADRFTALPDDETLGATVIALEEHGFSVEVVDDLDTARSAVLARIPNGSSVMTSTSVTLQETGIATRSTMEDRTTLRGTRCSLLDFATQAQEMKAIGGQPDYVLGSVHTVTTDGALVIASASGSQLASVRVGRRQRHLRRGRAEAGSHAGDRARPDLPAQPDPGGRGAYATYGQNSYVGKVLEIHQELPGRIHIVLIRRSIGY